MAAGFMTLRPEPALGLGPAPSPAISVGWADQRVRLEQIFRPADTFERNPPVQDHPLLFLQDPNHSDREEPRAYGCYPAPPMDLRDSHPVVHDPNCGLYRVGGGG